MNVAEKSRLYRELAKMLTAGFHMDRTVELLLNQRPSRGIRRYLRGLQRGFQQHQSLATAVREQNASQVTDLELSLITSGEVSGRLGQSFAHLSHYYETALKGIREARSAMIYPLILLHLGVVIPAFVKSILLGALQKVSKEGKDAAPPPSAVVEVLTHLSLFWLGLILVWLLWRMVKSLAKQSMWFDRLLGMIPLIGAARRHWALARFCQVFHSGLLAGMRIYECLMMGGDASQSGTVRSGTRKAYPKVLQGELLAESLRYGGGFPRIFVDSVATAEATGVLDNEVARWAVSETEGAMSAQRRAADWYPKILYFIILGYIGWRIITLMQTIMGAFGGVMNQL
jgi:type II secretory pathway component PulF